MKSPVPQDQLSECREYPRRPIAGVGAVVIDQGRVLLVRRRSEPLQGQWSIPGGAVELGESLKQAVTREVVEETGLTVVPIEHLKALERIERDCAGNVRFHYVLNDFLCRLAPEAAGGVPRAASDASEAAWVELEKIAGSSEYTLPRWTIDVIEEGSRRVRMREEPQPGLGRRAK